MRETEKNSYGEPSNVSPEWVEGPYFRQDHHPSGRKEGGQSPFYSGKEPVSDATISVRDSGLGERLRHWFVANTFAPLWLPRGLQNPVFGYLVAVLLQAIAILFTLYLDSLLHVFIFVGSLAVLAIALVALSWGVGPSVIGTFFGACFLDYVVLPPRYSLKLSLDDIYQLVLFMLIGLAISIAASQTERARRHAEHLTDSLTKEHARLETIIKTVPDIIALYDENGQIVQTNESGRQRKVFGSEVKSGSLEELVRIHDAFTLIGEAVTPDNLPVMHALRGETVESTEIRYIDKEGNEHFLSVSAAPLRDSHGKIDGIVSTTRDLSALHQSERDAANRAMELEAIFEALAEGLYVVDRGGGIVRSNKTFKDLMGFTDANSEAFFGLSRDERHASLQVSDEEGNLLPFDAWPESRVLRGEVLTGSSSVELRLHNLAGRVVSLSVTGAPLYNREGELISALCICRDVTERRKLEQRTRDALNALLAMAEALVVRSEEHAPEQESRTDAARVIALRMAALTSKVLDCPKVSIFLKERKQGLLHPMAIIGFSEAVEENWWKSVASSPLDASYEPATPLLARLQKGEVILLNTSMLEEPFHTWACTAQHLQIALLAPMNLGREMIGLLILGQEDANYHYTQEDVALVGAVSQLLALVFERERLLDERAESQATELALRTANQRMEEFLGMVSHELKTPLTSIKGNTQLAIRQLKNSMQAFERIVGLYEATEQQSRRLNRLVDDLLDVSRTQAGQLELIPGPCDLREIVNEALREEEKMWPERRIQLEMDAEVALPLQADADRIAQVILNYLNNALKYSDSDRPVFVAVRCAEDQVTLSVRDEGPGLSSEEQGHIWEQFHRVPGVEVRNSSHVSQAGLGLGLYISKMIIEGQGGEVGVQSLPGEGSDFWFRLPLSPRQV